MGLADELAYMSATELAHRIRTRQHSPVEVVEAFIERMERRNPSLNAFVYFLHGVPTAIKDLFDFKPGRVSTFGGIRALRNYVVDSYCAFAERVEGYKPSFGCVPFVVRPNAFAGVSPFLFEGPITRTVEDAALVVQAICGYDPRDPFSLEERVDLLSALRRSVRGLRIAYSPNLNVFPVDRRVREAVERAVRAFEEAGPRWRKSGWASAGASGN